MIFNFNIIIIFIFKFETILLIKYFNFLIFFNNK